MFLFTLMGGLSLFLYGMHMMTVGLEKTAGDNLKMILEKLTSHRLMGVLAGALITAIIQSSSATSVMVVGFVNSGLMTLTQALWIIMGANIGTTITGQLIALNIGEIAPLFALGGVGMIVFSHHQKVNDVGEIIAGLGVLFIGMNMMSQAMAPLQESQTFIQLLTTIKNPIFAVIIGALFTAIIQSSSASIGILQALANNRLIALSSSIYIIFGQNIGTCITAFLASLSANRNAKRTTLLHLSFNLIGTILFMMAIQFIPLVDIITNLTSNPSAQIAHTHTIFNIITTLILLPFGHQLVKFTEILLPINESEKKEKTPLSFINMNTIGNASIALSNLKKEAREMLEISRNNLMSSIQQIEKQDNEIISKIEKKEKIINQINYEVTEYMSKVSLLQMNQMENDTCNSIYKCFIDMERIGDHAINILKHSKTKETRLKHVSLIKDELYVLQEYLQQLFAILLEQEINEINSQKIIELENQIDELTENYRQNQIHRLMEGKIDANDCVAYSQIMSDIERVSDHMMNIMQEMKQYNYTFCEDVNQKNHFQ